MDNGKVKKNYQKEKLTNQISYRLVNSKFPPATLFDDIINADDFETAYAIQSLTNPRVLTILKNLSLLAISEIPFGISGVNYATAPFTHINPTGSRFSNGDFGILYLADTVETAIKETRYHQERYFQNIDGLHYDTIDMRCLKAIFTAELVDATTIDEIHHPDDYSASRKLGYTLKQSQEHGIKYHSVRNHNALCWGLFSPIFIASIIQTKHYEFIFDGKSITAVRELV